VVGPVLTIHGPPRRNDAAEAATTSGSGSEGGFDVRFACERSASPLFVFESGGGLMLGSGHRSNVRRIAVAAATSVLFAGVPSWADTVDSADIAVPADEVVVRETETETAVTVRDSADDDSAYGEPIEMQYIEAERDAFAFERAPNKAVGVAESLGGLIFNSFFFPLKLAIGVGGAAVGGTIGALSGGDERSAAQIWNVTTDGSYFITPSEMEGKRPFRLTGDHP
jgi:hypothetical protein